MLALLAAAALAGCNKEDHTIVAGGPADDDANRVAANANVELPPSIASSKIYRCKDNSVVYVDWMSDNKTANVRARLMLFSRSRLTSSAVIVAAA